MSSLLGCVVVLIVVILVCLGLFAHYAFRWPYHYPPERSFSGEELLLKPEDLPEGWRMVENYSHGPARYSAGTWGREFRLQDEDGNDIARIVNFVRIHATIEYAQMTYEEDLDYEKRRPLMQNLFQPRYADEWHLACGGEGKRWETDFDCTYIARYEEFYLLFFVHEIRSPGAFFEHIGYQQVTTWLTLIDTRAGRLLGKGE